MIIKIPVIRGENDDGEWIAPSQPIPVDAISVVYDAKKDKDNYLVTMPGE
jgi:hypothetical protein